MTETNKDFILRLKAVIDTAIDGILTIDDKGIVETINPAAAKLFDYLPNEVIGNNIKMLMPNPDRAQHDGYLKRYQETKKPRIIGIGREVKGLKKSGVTFPFRLAVSEVILNDRVIYTGIVHDLTEMNLAQTEIINLNKQLEEKITDRTYELESTVNKLLAANNQLNKEIDERREAENKLKVQELELKGALSKEKELNELKSRFVSMASHEFRTPLTSILSSAAIIGKYSTAEQQPNREKHIVRIKSAVTNLTGILNDFLSLSKLEEGLVEVQLQKLNIDHLCDEIIIATEGLRKGQQNIIHTVHGNKTYILVDERILKNILFNLLSNAIKYSEEDIECHIYLNEDNFIIKVIDHGIGIPIEDQKYLFTRFFRAGNVTNIQGTGLGLNIVKQYIHILNGEIICESEHEVGTTFTVTIPYPNN